MTRCDNCKTSPMHPDCKCCFNCARSGSDCGVWHTCGDDCPGWGISNADRIRSMSDEELAVWISDIAYAGKTPWDSQFARKFCDSCPRIKGTLPDGKTIDLYECDFVDGKCPHGSDIAWWLEQRTDLE